MSSKARKEVGIVSVELDTGDVVEGMIVQGVLGDIRLDLNCGRIEPDPDSAKIRGVEVSYFGQNEGCGVSLSRDEWLLLEERSMIDRFIQSSISLGRPDHNMVNWLLLEDEQLLLEDFISRNDENLEVVRSETSTSLLGSESGDKSASTYYVLSGKDYDGNQAYFCGFERDDRTEFKYVIVGNESDKRRVAFAEYLDDNSALWLALSLDYARPVGRDRSFEMRRAASAMSRSIGGISTSKLYLVAGIALSSMASDRAIASLDRFVKVIREAVESEPESIVRRGGSGELTP